MNNINQSIELARRAAAEHEARHRPKSFDERVVEIADLNFDRFASLFIAKVVWGCSIVLAVVLTLIGVIASGFLNGLDGAIWSSFTLPLIACVLLLAIRVCLELAVAIFKIAENTSRGGRVQ